MKTLPGAWRHRSISIFVIGVTLCCSAIASSDASASTMPASTQTALSRAIQVPLSKYSRDVTIPIPHQQAVDPEAGIRFASDKKTKKDLWDIFTDDMKQDTKDQEKKKEDEKKKKKKKEQPKERKGNSGSNY